MFDADLEEGMEEPRRGPGILGLVTQPGDGVTKMLEGHRRVGRKGCDFTQVLPLGG